MGASQSTAEFVVSPVGITAGCITRALNCMGDGVGGLSRVLVLCLLTGGKDVVLCVHRGLPI